MDCMLCRTQVPLGHHVLREHSLQPCPLGSRSGAAGFSSTEASFLSDHHDDQLETMVSGISVKYGYEQIFQNRSRGQQGCFGRQLHQKQAAALTDRPIRNGSPAQGGAQKRCCGASACGRAAASAADDHPAAAHQDVHVRG